ncbi:MAG: SxtJ family membrane protein [Syntrophobacteraceae bacterium]
MTNQAAKKTNENELRTFAITISVILGMLGGLILLRKGQAGLILVAIGAILFIVGVAWPKSLAIPHKVWMTISIVLGFITSHIVLALVYYIVLTPIGLFMRIMGKDRLTLRFDPMIDSYWIKRKDKEWSMEKYEKMF